MKPQKVLLRRAMFVIFAFLILLPFFIPPAGAAGYIAAVNDSLLPMTPAYMPERAGGNIYLPQAVFESPGLGLFGFFNYELNEYSLYNGLKTLRFSLSSGVAYDYDRQYDFAAYMSGGRVYVPAKEVCDYFGLQYGYWADISAVRVAKNPLFSMGTFRNLFEADIKALIEGSSTSPSPSGGTNSPSIPPTSATATPTLSRADIYLAFEGLSDEYTPSILDALSEAGIKAAFFVYGEDIRANAPLIARIYCAGHTIGLMGNEPGVMTNENMTAQFDLANEALDEIIFTKTRVILFPEGSKTIIGDESQLLEELFISGYRLWDYTPGCENPGRGSDRANTYLRNTRNLISSLNNPSVMRFAAEPVLCEALPNILTHLSANGLPVMLINEIAKPINGYDFIK